MAKGDIQVCLIKLCKSFLWLMAGEGVRDCSHKKDLMQVASRSREWLTTSKETRTTARKWILPTSWMSLGAEPTLADTLIPEHSILPNTQTSDLQNCDNERVLFYESVVICYTAGEVI